MNGAVRGALISALIAGMYADVPNSEKTTTKPEKECVNCGKLHSHNNVACSAECFREYKAKS